MAQTRDYRNSVVETVTVTIANGQTISDGKDLAGSSLKTIVLPATFTGTEIYFQISDDGITYYDYYNIDNDRVKITTTANRAYGLGAIDFFSIRWLKIVSNTTEAADRVIKLITRGI